jgi:hypothetical protein
MTSDHNSRNTNRPAGSRCRISAVRDEITGQFYALSHEDRIAFNKHCAGIVADLAPVNHRERWLATSIAEDQWRLNRARALENNIFAIGMSSPIIDINSGNPETDAAVCQARVWLADGKQLQMLALYESRIRRSIEKNEKQLKELQAERQAAHDKALEEAKLLARLAIVEGETYVYEDGECAASPEANGTGIASPSHGFGFSTEEILRLVRREMRLEQAALLKKQGWRRPTQMPKAA